MDLVSFKIICCLFLLCLNKILAATIEKSDQLLLFIAVTSSPNHPHLRNADRMTWIESCQTSPYCDYRFFIDSHKNISESLEEEESVHHDIVFRDECDLMKRHPDYINYGNSPPTFVDYPDYPLRRMYKIDWKVCFMRFIEKNYGSNVPLFLSFVEDDSILCTNNLMKQLEIVHELNPHLTFRTGSTTHDGFDDSSTLMTSDIMRSFLDNYHFVDFNCSHIWNSTDPDTLKRTSFLSWGNSWKANACDWRQKVHDFSQLNVQSPFINCFFSKVDVSNSNMSAACDKHNLVLHHSRPLEVLTKKLILHEACRYTIFIDKVKEPKDIFNFWNYNGNLTNFFNYSTIFLTQDKTFAWKQFLTEYAIEQESRRCSVTGSLESSADCRRSLSNILSRQNVSKGNKKKSHSSTDVKSLVYNALLRDERAFYFWGTHIVDSLQNK